MLFTVLSGLVTGLVIHMLRTSTGTTNRLTNVNELRVATDAVTKGLRTAVRPEQLNTTNCTAADCARAFVDATATSATFYGNHGKGTTAAPRATVTTYRVEDDPCIAGSTSARLVEIVRASEVPGTVAATTPAAGTCPIAAGGRTLADGLTWNAASPPVVFTYFDESCSALDPLLTATARLAKIGCIKVSIPIDGARDNPGASATSTVFLPNSVMGR